MESLKITHSQEIDDKRMPNDSKTVQIKLGFVLYEIEKMLKEHQKRYGSTIYFSEKECKISSSYTDLMNMNKLSIVFDPKYLPDVRKLYQELEDKKKARRLNSLISQKQQLEQEIQNIKREP